jgi:hypothetical protein
MDLQEFLETVTPSGTHVVARKVDLTAEDGRKFSSFVHTVASTTEEATGSICRQVKLNADIYYALASYKQGFYKITTKSGREKKVIRVRENVDRLKALWFDIDFKSGYSDGAAAVTALKAFCEATGLPLPSLMVHSGNGIHVYWPLTEAVSVADWEPLAEALKQAAKDHGLKADLACTADACRVLRPPLTYNYKEPENPKLVKLLYSNGCTFDFASLSAILGKTPALSDLPSYMKSVPASFHEFTGGSGAGGFKDACFSTITEHCSVVKHILDTQGAEQSEPEWSATLQLLKHCEDGALWVHQVSSGHPGYIAEDTDRKWQIKVDNDAGPTLCKTFELYHSAKCLTCPFYGKIKTPLSLGTEAATADAPKGVVLTTWRPVKNGDGMERKMFDTETNKYVWEKVLRRTVGEVHTSRSVVSRQYEMSFTANMRGSRVIEISLPSSYLGNQQKLKETMAGFGAPLLANEVNPFISLMSTWLEKLQAARAVNDVTEQLGWIENADTEKHEVIGFSCGPTSYYTDGTTRSGVRTSREFAAISKLYIPHGSAEPWTRVAGFLTKQNNPAFMAVLASAFASPLLPFTGIPGGILSIVSKESGVGKSSAMRAAQAVWGSPSHGMNSVDDTRLSVARKLGFIKNLPAYWDELRGKRTMEEFMMLAFQVAQGKEKTRLDSNASMREVNTWQTMLVAASNESVFDYMSKTASGSDAGMARTFEITVDPFVSEIGRAEVAVMFAELEGNYGWAGQKYSEYLALNHVAIRDRIEVVFTNLGQVGMMRPAERFWFAIIATLVVGSECAKKAGICEIDVRSMASFLLHNVESLRNRTEDIMIGTTPKELLASFIQNNQDKVLIVDKFPARGARTDLYTGQIISPPKAGKLVVHLAQTDGRVRVMRSDFEGWLARVKGVFFDSVRDEFKTQLMMDTPRVSLGVGTSFALPRSRVLEMNHDITEGLDVVLPPDEEN